MLSANGFEAVYGEVVSLIMVDQLGLFFFFRTPPPPPDGQLYTVRFL